MFFFANDNLNKDVFLLSGHEANRDILTLSLVDQIDTENVYLAHSIVVNYRGYKIVAKTLPNSLITANSEAKSVGEIFHFENKAQND